jgi:dUTP pyrophosphatase
MIYKKKTSISDKQLIRQHPGDAGLDIVCAEDFAVYPGMSHVVSTELYVAIPQGWCGIVTGRSGIWYSKDIAVPIGVIDSGYRGEIRVKMVNLLQSKVFDPETLAGFEFKRGDRIAQMLVVPVYSLQPTEIDELPEADRGCNGFGSTGL